ncbi:MAG TPA: nitroreductase/quinone reductase family protein [Gaiellaceae bacterium]
MSSDEQEQNVRIIEGFRANDGRVGGHFEGRPLLLLTTTGAKSERRQMAPVMCLADGDPFIVFASNNGYEQNPGWYHNLRADPDVVVEVGTKRFWRPPSSSAGDERDELFRAKRSATHSSRSTRARWTGACLSWR